MPAQRQTHGMIERILGHRVCSILAGLLHLGLSLWTFISMTLDGSGSTVLAVLVCLASIAFCVLLLIGILKKNKCMVMSYLIYSILYILLIFILFILCMVYINITVGWFFSTVFYILLLLLIFFVVFTYFAATYRTQSTQTNGV